MNGKPTKTMLKRMLITMLALVIVTVSVCSVRLAIIMLVDGKEYQAKASEQQLYDTTISAPRGNIYDTNMNLLATSGSAWNVYITPNSLKTIKEAEKLQTVKNLLADNLSEILQIDRETVYGYTEKTSSYYITIKKRIDKETADKVRAFITENKDYNISSYIGLDETTKRYYPNNSLASVVLGFVGDDNQGLSGLEQYYDTKLTGVPGRVVAARNAKGTDMPFTYQKTVDPIDGYSLVTSIDTYVQYVTEKYLEQAVNDNAAAQKGAAIVMNVKTGEILAMAIKGDFDPNSPFTLSESDNALLEGLEGDERSKQLAALRNRQWRNKAVSDTYEPGSVFKVITVATALEEGVTNFNNTFTCPGYITISGQRYSCHKKIGHGTQTLLQATQNSCNPAFITLGTLLGPSTFSKYFEAFGLTKKTGIDLPGESSPVYHAESKMGPTELASSAFGQTFKVTPIQLITAISAAVNGGSLVTPHVVNRVLDQDGNIIESVGTSVKRQVISKETSSKVCELLEKVVDGGTAKNAYVAGYRIGGKTGTSQKVAEMLATGQKGLYIASFCGIAPIDDPQIAVLVLIDEPTGSAYYGGTVAAPVGGQILSDILPYLGYEPQYTDEQLSKLALPVPYVVGKTLSEAKNTVTNAKLTYKVVGNGSTVIDQIPASTQSIYTGGLVVLYTEENTEKRMATVPDFMHLSVSQVNSAASNAGINVEFAGSSVTTSGITAYKQSISAGETVEQGTVVTVYFRDSGGSD